MEIKGHKITKIFRIYCSIVFPYMKQDMLSHNIAIQKFRRFLIIDKSFITVCKNLSDTKFLIETFDNQKTNSNNL